MAENTESQIKAPIIKEETTSQATESGVSNALKKALPKISNSINKGVVTPVKNASLFIGDSVRQGLNDVSVPFTKSAEKLKDFGRDLFVDATDMVKDVVSPGGLTTMLTGSPLLGALVGNKVSEAWDYAKDTVANVRENFNEVKKQIDSPKDDIKNDIKDDNSDIITSVDDTNDSVTTKIGEVVSATDITNDLLFNLLNTNKSFNKLYRDGQVQLLKDKREEELRLAEAERERLDALKKNQPEAITKEEKEDKEDGWFSNFFKKLKGTSGGLLSSIGMIAKLLAKALITLTVVVAAFNGIFTFFRELKNGASIKEALIAGLTDFIHVLTLGLVDKDTIKGLVDFFVSPIYDFIVGFGKGLFGVIEGLWNTIAGIWNGDWERVKSGLFKFGDSIEQIFSSIIDFFVDIVKSVWKIGEKIGGWFAKWFSDDDKEEQKKKQLQQEEQLNNLKFNKSDESVKSIIESSKQITELQRPIQTTIINNNTNNMTQMSNNNAIGKTNMIIQSSLRNNDPTFNQCLISNMVPNM